MPTDRSLSAPDPNELRLSSNLDWRYWTQKLGVTRDSLDAAIREVGTQVDVVIAHLEGRERERRAGGELRR